MVHWTVDRAFDYLKPSQCYGVDHSGIMHEQHNIDGLLISSMQQCIFQHTVVPNEYGNINAQGPTFE